MRRIITAAVIIIATLTGCNDTSDWTQGYEPCATEDSTSCYWDADTMGNGQGTSYTVDEHGQVTQH